MGVKGAESARHVGCPGILTDCRERPAQGLSGSCHPGNHVRPAVHICPQLPCENGGQRSKKCAPRRLSRDPNRLSGTPSARPGWQLPPWQPRQACCRYTAPSSPAKIGVNGAKSARHVGCPGILTDCRERPAQGLSGSCHPGNHAKPAVHICPQLPCENRGQRSKKCASRRLSRDPNRLSGTPSARPIRQLPPWQPRQACCTYLPPAPLRKSGSTEQNVRAT